MHEIDLDETTVLSPFFGGEEELITYRNIQSNCAMFVRSADCGFLEWAARGIGFGQIYLSSNTASTELLSRNFLASLFYRHITTAAWSNEGYRHDEECFSVRHVALDNDINEFERIRFRYESDVGSGFVSIGQGTRNHGKVPFVWVEDSPLKSENAVWGIVRHWLESIDITD